MINWKNLEKFIAPGKVVTLVLLIDGEEVGAFSFNVDSLAFKEALEAASHLDPVKVAEKKAEPAKSTKKAEPAKPKPEPEPLDEDEDEDDEDPEEILGDNDIDKVFVAEKKEEPKPVTMTREQIMAQAGTAAEKPVEKPAEEPKKPIQPTLADEW